MLKIVKHIFITLLITLILAEVGVRLIGWGAAYNRDYSVESRPDHWLKGDTLLGIGLVPGDFSITLNHLLTFNAKHESSGRRFISDRSSEDSIALFGCSFTYGYGVNDDQTFAFLIEKELNEYKVVNHAVPGYGTSQAVIQLRKLLNSGSRPKIAVLVFSSFHPERNTMALSYRKALQIGFVRSNQENSNALRRAKFPYRTVDMRDLWVEWSDMYANWPGREYSALVNSLQSSFEKDISEEHQLRVTETLLLEFVEQCEKHNVHPVIVNLDDRKFTEHYPECTNLETDLIHVKFNFNDAKLTNKPIDNHPNPKGHQFIAERILDYFDRMTHEVN